MHDATNCQTRRTFLQRFAVWGIVTAGFVRSAGAQSKKKSDNKKGKNSNAAIQDFGVCYTRPVTAAECAAFKEVILEPGHYSESAFIPPADNGIAYVSLSSLFKGHAMQVQLRQRIDGAGGWLRDANGIAVRYDAQDKDDKAIWLIDLRKPGVQDALKDYVSNVLDINHRGVYAYKGIYFDSLDQLMLLETDANSSKSNHYKGLHKAATAFIKSIAEDIDKIAGKRKGKAKTANRKPKLIVSGGISDPPAGMEDSLKILAPHVNAFLCVDQATENGAIRDAHDFTVRRLKEAILAAKDHPLLFYPIERTPPPGVSPLDTQAAQDPRSRQLIQDVNAYWKTLAQDLAQSLKEEGTIDAKFEVLMPYCSFDPSFGNLRQYAVDGEPGK